jgi:hypothetical protein
MERAAISSHIGSFSAFREKQNAAKSFIKDGLGPAVPAF